MVAVTAAKVAKMRASGVKVVVGGPQRMRAGETCTSPQVVPIMLANQPTEMPAPTAFLKTMSFSAAQTSAPSANTMPSGIANTGGARWRRCTTSCGEAKRNIVWSEGCLQIDK